MTNKRNSSMKQFISMALLTVAASASAGTFDNGIVRLDMADRGVMFDATQSGIITRHILPPDGEKITGIQYPSWTFKHL